MANNNKTEYLHVKLTPELKKAIQDRADKDTEGNTSVLVRTLIIQYLRGCK